jgi:hypothetical protein
MEFYTVVDKVEHDCCHNATLVKTVGGKPDDLEKEYGGSRVAEFFDDDEAREVANILNRYLAMQPGGPV